MDAGNKERGGKWSHFRPEKQFFNFINHENMKGVNVHNWHWAPSLNWIPINIFLCHTRKLAPHRYMYMFSVWFLLAGEYIRRRCRFHIWERSRILVKLSWASQQWDDGELFLLWSPLCNILTFNNLWSIVVKLMTKPLTLLFFTKSSSRLFLLYFKLVCERVQKACITGMQLSILRTWIFSFSGMHWFTFSTQQELYWY